MRADSKTVSDDRRPIRTCLGCRRKRPLADLLRLALLPGPAGDKVVFDKGRRLGGRGAWLCPDDNCLALALKKRAFGRAFRQDRPIDLSELIKNDR